MEAGKKQRWYDGPLYALFYDPLDRPNKAAICSLIPPGSSVLDLACGTGALCLDLGQKASRVVGVDASERMLSHARVAASRRGACNVSFRACDAAAFSEAGSGPFDYAVFSLFFHEVEEQVRLAALSRAAAISRRVILSDFASPQPKNAAGFFNIGVERIIGGRENFRLFREFMENGGVSGLADRLGLAREKFFRDPSGARDFLVVTGTGA